MPVNEFRFIGFLPPKSGARRKVLQKLAHEQTTIIFYESPHRLLESLEDVVAVLGNRSIAVARELDQSCTKSSFAVRRKRCSTSFGCGLQSKAKSRYWLEEHRVRQPEAILSRKSHGFKLPARSDVGYQTGCETVRPPEARFVPAGRRAPEPELNRPR